MNTTKTLTLGACAVGIGLLGSCGLQEKYEKFKEESQERKWHREGLKNKNWNFAYWQGRTKQQDLETTETMIDYVINNTNENIVKVVKEFAGNQLEIASSIIKSNQKLQNIINGQIQGSLNNRTVEEAYTWNSFLSKTGTTFTNNLEIIGDKAAEEEDTNTFYLCAINGTNKENQTILTKQYINNIKTLTPVFVSKEKLQSKMYDKSKGHTEERGKVLDEIRFVKGKIEKSMDRIGVLVSKTKDKKLSKQAAIESLKYASNPLRDDGTAEFLLDPIYEIAKISEDSYLLSKIGRKAKKFGEYDIVFNAFYSAGNKKELVKLGKEMIPTHFGPESENEYEMELLNKCYLATGDKDLKEYSQDYYLYNLKKEIKPLK